LDVLRLVAQVITKIVFTHKLKGADINFVSKEDNNRAGIHVSVIEGNLCTLMLLVQNRADVGLVDNQGWTALHYAAQAGN
jgi:ankyrin repeat protein